MPGNVIFYGYFAVVGGVIIVSHYLNGGKVDTEFLKEALSLPPL